MTELRDPLTSAQFAKLIGVSERAVRAMADSGTITRAGRGRYPLAAVAEYAQHLREVASGRGGADRVASLTDERARLAAEQADAMAMKNAVARGELVEATAVAREWTDILRQVRSRLLAVPSRVRQRLPHLTPTDVVELDRELRDALQELSDARPCASRSR